MRHRLPNEMDFKAVKAFLILHLLGLHASSKDAGFLV